MGKLLDNINSPKDLKNLSKEDLTFLAQEIREKIIGTVSRTGGHLSSNLGVVELTIALHYVLNTPEDKIVWDVGHQCYTHKLLTGRKENFSTLRQYGGLAGFPRREESPYDAFNTGHSSTSISAALGMACARDKKGGGEKIVAVIGDGSLTAGMAFEALNHAGQLQKDLIVILNDNKMSISPTVGNLSRYLNWLISTPLYNETKKELERLLEKLPVGLRLVRHFRKLERGVKLLLVPGVLFEELGFKYIGPLDGHNLPALVTTLENVAQLKGPIFVHVLTKKGKGYEKAEEDPVRFHSTRPFDIQSGKTKEEERGVPPTYTQVFGETLVEMAEKDEKIVAVTAAMPEGTGLSLFRERFPGRFYDVGIAEQHAVTFAAGLASQGLKPVVAIYSTFLQRAFDQILHDVCLPNLKVVFMIDRAGIVGEDGPTHQGIFDFAYLSPLPNMIIVAPGDENELRSMFTSCWEWPNPVAIRYPKDRGVGGKENIGTKNIALGQAEILKEGKDLFILAIGSMVYPSLRAAEELTRRGIDAGMINARFLSPLDEDLIIKCAQRTKKLVTCEEHIGRGGLGNRVKDFLLDREVEAKVLTLALPDKFIEQGKREILLEKYGLNTAGITRAVEEWLKS